MRFNYGSSITRSWNIWFHKMLLISYYQGDRWLVKKVFVPWHWWLYKLIVYEKWEICKIPLATILNSVCPNNLRDRKVMPYESRWTLSFTCYWWELWCYISMLLPIVIVLPHTWLRFTINTFTVVYLATEVIHVSYNCDCPRSACSLLLSSWCNLVWLIVVPIVVACWTSLCHCARR